MSISMFDSVDVGTVPSNPQAVAGYVGGNWPTYWPLYKKFPRAYHLGIAVSASENADCLDIEGGDAVPAQAPAWVTRQIHRGIFRPVVYSSTSNMPSVLDALSRGGISRSEVRVWTAHYTWQSHIEPGSDGTQWTERALGRNLDESSLKDDFFIKQARVNHHINKVHYERFQRAPFLVRNGRVINELETVAAYDKLRVHPVLHHAKLRHLEELLAELAGRIYTVAQEQADSNGNAAWGPYWRGWRFQQLIHRSQGRRFV